MFYCLDCKVSVIISDTRFDLDQLHCSDSHIHVSLLGESQHYVNLSSCHSIETIITALQLKIAEEPDLPFYIGFNWDQTVLGRCPYRHDLDDLTDKPVRTTCFLKL